MGRYTSLTLFLSNHAVPTYSKLQYKAFPSNQTPRRSKDLMTSSHTKEEIHLDCFSPWLALGFVDLRRSNQVKYGLRGESNAVHWLLTGDISLLVFHCTRMKPIQSLPRRLWKKQPSKEQLCPNLSPFAIVYCYSSPCVLHRLLHTPASSSSWSLTILSNLYLNLCLRFSPPSATFLLSQLNHPSSSPLSRHFAPSEPVYRQSLMHYGHSHQSWFCFTAEKSRLSFWLHINCSVGTWSRIVKYLPIFLLSCTFLSSSFIPSPIH